MTPDQLAVERDRLLEGGRMPEEVAAMQAGVTLLDALCVMVDLYGRDLDIDEGISFRFVDAALVQAHGHGVFGKSQLRGDAIIQRLTQKRESPAPE